MISLQTTINNNININYNDLNSISDALNSIGKNSAQINLQTLINHKDFIGFIKYLQDLRDGCVIFSNFLKTYIVKLSTPKVTGKVFKDIQVEDNNKDSYSQIILQGTKIIFMLRQFLTGESLSFVLGGSLDGKQLVQVKKTQDELFNDMQNLRVSFSNGQIELSRNIENLNNYQDYEFLENGSLAAQWEKILEWGFIPDYNLAEEISSHKNNNVVTHIYRKRTADINVYLRFKTSASTGTKNGRTAQHYYGNGAATSVKGMLAYDRGWLYQWIKMYEQADQLAVQQILTEFQSNTLTPLKTLMTGNKQIARRESDPGIRGGDFGSEQYKYTNRRVITLNNIYNILNGGGGRNGYFGIIESIDKILGAKNIKELNENIENLSLDFINKNRITLLNATKDNLMKIFSFSS